MMTATAISATTGSDTTTTSGLDSGSGSGSRLEIAVAISNSITQNSKTQKLKNDNSRPHTKLYPNRTKNIKGKKTPYWSALVGWSGQSKKKP